MIRITDVHKKFVTDNREIPVLNGLSLNLPGNGLVFIRGKSGSGKTTLLNLLSAIDFPTSGSIEFMGKNISEFSERKTDDYRNLCVGLIFQESNIIENCSVFENLKLALDIQKWEGKSKESAEKIICSLLDFVGIGELVQRKGNNLSGGEKQRVAIARALAKAPKVILADEPTGSLDHTNSLLIYDLLKKVSKQCLVIVVSHDIQAADDYADRIIDIENGIISRDIENRYSNDYSGFSYSVDFQSENNEMQSFQGMTHYELIRMIRSEIPSEPNRQKQLRINVEATRTDSAVLKEEADLSYLETKREAIPLTNRSLIKLSLRNIAGRKLRTFFTVTMFAITLMIVMLIAFIYKHDSLQAIKGYLDDSGLKELIPYQTVEYTDKLFETHAKSIRSGLQHQMLLAGIAGENNVYGVATDFHATYSNSVTDEYRSAGELSAFVYRTQPLSFPIEGRFPVDGTEVAITDFVANRLHLSINPIGTSIEVHGMKVKVSGIIRTDYIEYGILDKLENSGMNEYENYRYLNDYNLIFLHENFLLNMPPERKGIQTSCFNFFHSDRSLYLSYFSELSGIESLDATEKLYFGRTPENKNEVVISYTYAYENGIIDDLGNVQNEELNRTYFFKDIYDASYNGYYLDTINLYNYFPEGIRVVGISEQDIPVILFEQMKFDQVYSDYVRSYIFDHYTISLRDVSTQEFIQFARENELFLDEPSVNKIYAFLNVINTFILAVIFVLVVLVIISLLMVTTSISASIKHNSKIIGIIRSLGVTGKDTVKIYVVEAFLLWLGSSAAAILLVGVVLAVTNALFRKTLPEKPFDILYWNVPVVALCIFAGLILILIASIIPIRSFARKKPVEVIREQ